MKSLKIRPAFTCLLLNLAVGLPCISGATFFMKSIEIKSKKYGTHYLLVDDEDYELVMSRKWHVNKMKHTFYASTEIWKDKVKTQIRVHRFLLGNVAAVIDHKDGNGLNNQRSNLRPCSQNQNIHNSRVRPWNSTGYKGVWFSKERSGAKKFHSQISANGKRIFVGYFDNPHDAAIAYNKAAIKYHGEFAHLNQIKTDETINHNR